MQEIIFILETLPPAEEDIIKSYWLMEVFTINLN